jgi:uncharacterized membrane protein (UPF0127 family)
MNETAQKIFAIVSLPIVVAVALFVVMKQRGNDDAVMPTVSIGGKTWTVELADTDAARRKGLGDRDALCGTCGMLFRFDAPGEYGFWMKGMRFPLDIAWIEGGKVIFLEKDIPADSKDTFTPTESADSVLEVNAGDLANVSVGDAVTVKE